MPIGFNIMEQVGAEQRYFVAAGLMAAFKKIWVDVWSARMEYILNNALLAILEYPDSTIMGANRMLADKDYRKKVVDNVKDPAVKSYWINEFAKYPERYREEATSAIQNKIGQFISNPLIRNIVGQTKSTFNIREIMDNQKILILNLSKGRIGEDNTALLGTMLITKMQIAAMSRVDIPEEKRNDFFFYIDEFQTFATPSFAGILSEARKYRLSLVLAHQYIAQMDEIVRDAVFGNAGTLVSFRVGAADAEFMENEFVPSFLPEDLVNLAKYNIALKLMIDGITSRAFSARTLAPIEAPEESERDAIVQMSRELYGKSRQDTEEKILAWSGMGQVAEKAEESPASPRRIEAGPPREARSETRPHFSAICSRCGKSTELSFKPDGQRPVYCNECFAKVMRERDSRRSAPRQAAPRRPEVNLTSLRATLKDIARPGDSPYGIMEEGREITF
jgi:CxxC-x17-CxxC domain-containing protein